MNKAKIVGWVIASPFILIGIGIAFCEANKAYWDYQVKQMCEKDGGVTVYEKVEMTPEVYKNLKIPFERNTRPSDLYYRVSLEDVVLHETPRVSKGGQKIVRQSDNKVLGLQITYGRSGGDFPIGISHQSSFWCGQVQGVNLNIEKSIFFSKGVE